MSLARALVVVVAIVLLARGPVAQDGLQGRWIGTSEGNKGEVLTIDAQTFAVGGQRLPYRTTGPGVLVLGGEDGERVDYKITGDVLALTTEGETLTFARDAAGKPKAPAQGGAGGNPLGRKADAFARAFRGDGLELSLTATADAAYRGSLVFQGATYPAEATTKGERLQGRFRSGDDWFDFTATLAGDQLTLESGGSTYRLAGEPLAAGGPRNPLERGGGAPGDGKLPELTGVFAGKTTRFDHPRGWFGFDMPEGWTVHQQSELGMLLNPGLKPTDTLDAMIGLMWGRLEAGDLNQPVGKVMQQRLPQLRQTLAEQGLSVRDGEASVETFRGKDVPGAVVVLAADTPQGQKCVVWCGSMIKRDAWIAVSGVVLEGKEEVYLPKVKRIFASLEPRPPERNAALEAALVGRSFSSSQYGRVTSSASHATYAFAGGGQVTRRLMTNIAAEPGLPGASVDAERTGRYEVCGDVLYLYFETGQEAGQVLQQQGQVAGIRLGNAEYR